MFELLFMAVEFLVSVFVLSIVSYLVWIFGALVFVCLTCKEETDPALKNYASEDRSGLSPGELNLAYLREKATALTVNKVEKRDAQLSKMSQEQKDAQYMPPELKKHLGLI